ncbi:winged helix-turn-helix domain-containing protein [Bradyrhizobium sp. HKCCYLS1011]|uniref:winged helix-turn-helix domain-containing protein n=1 Tax=Bradyrhizobium sp. HKCCYLS1011 TaxID=3420733 RepID=UPI003EBB08BF
MNIGESIDTARTTSDRQTWRPPAPTSAALANIRSRPTGIILSCNAQEIGSFLSDFYDVYCYAHHDVTRAAHHFDSSKLQFLILEWADREPTLQALAWTRTTSTLPTIVTGPASEPECVAALEAGAADYVVPSVGKRELLARISAVLRYHRPSGANCQAVRKEERSAGQHIYEFGLWRLDTRHRRFTDPHGSHIALTRSEYALLTVFVEAPRRVLTREYLVKATRMAGDTLDRSIDVRILRLRRKLRAAAPDARLISTERGIGYRFSMSVERR